MPLRRSELLLVSLHTEPPQQVLLEWTKAQRPFECWLRGQLQDLLGWNVQEGQPEPQQEVLFVRPDENPGS